MITVREIEKYLAAKAPYAMKEDFDNVGLLAGEGKAAVERVLVALDITDWVVREAESLGCQLIVSHHPVTFGLKSITDADPTGRVLLRLLKSEISAICMHTNLDSAPGGVNDVLMKVLGVRPEGVLAEAQRSELGEFGLGRYGKLSEETPLLAFLGHVKTVLKANGLRYYDAGRPVQKLAVCGGSGGEFLEDANALGCDTYLTADVKYDRFLTAKALGINLIDAGHFSTENPVVPVLAGILREAFPSLDIRISESHGQTEKYYV